MVINHSKLLHCKKKHFKVRFVDSIQNANNILGGILDRFLQVFGLQPWFQTTHFEMYQNGVTILKGIATKIPKPLTIIPCDISPFKQSIHPLQDTNSQGLKFPIFLYIGTIVEELLGHLWLRPQQQVTSVVLNGLPSLAKKMPGVALGILLNLLIVIRFSNHIMKPKPMV